MITIASYVRLPGPSATEQCGRSLLILHLELPDTYRLFDRKRAADHATHEVGMHLIGRKQSGRVR